MCRLSSWRTIVVFVVLAGCGGTRSQPSAASQPRVAEECAQHFAPNPVDYPSRHAIACVLSALASKVRSCSVERATVHVKIVFDGETGRARSAEALYGNTSSPDPDAPTSDWYLDCVESIMLEHALLPRFTAQPTFQVTFPYRLGPQ
jgi:hypothetical protein